MNKKIYVQKVCCRIIWVHVLGATANSDTHTTSVLIALRSSWASVWYGSIQSRGIYNHFLPMGCNRYAVQMYIISTFVFACMCWKSFTYYILAIIMSMQRCTRSWTQTSSSEQSSHNCFRQRDSIPATFSDLCLAKDAQDRQIAKHVMNETLLPTILWLVGRSKWKKRKSFRTGA